ncbi:MAG: DUF58 domain-containing protein [Nocardioides sp.]|jgi:uncharacterized protein (DUF58 family)
MRTALANLTTRGRAFLAGGLTAVVCAIVLGHDSLVRVGLLAVALPLIASVFMARSRFRLSLVRAVSPRQVSAGTSAEVNLTLTNEGRTPTGVLLLEEQVPFTLGSRPRFVLAGIQQGWHRQVHYRVRSDVRGRFDIGPMQVRVRDPFGFVESQRTFRAVNPLIVTPRTVPLSRIPLGGDWTGSGDNRPRAFATGSAEDVTVREYRRGDDLRRVHWRSSARVGDLMVRREEQPWQSRATLFLDNRSMAHRGQGIASSFETAISAAASIALHVARAGFQVRLVTAVGEELGVEWHQRDDDSSAAPLLASLAVLRLTSATHITSHWLAEAGSGGLTIGVFGALSTPDQPVVRRMRHTSGAALALAVDVARWGGSTIPGQNSGEEATGMLTRSGWRAAPLRPTDQLDTVWKLLGQTPLAPIPRRAVTR